MCGMERASARHARLRHKKVVAVSVVRSHCKVKTSRLICHVGQNAPVVLCTLWTHSEAKRANWWRTDLVRDGDGHCECHETSRREATCLIEQSFAQMAGPAVVKR